jgi:hypothetical protein
LPEKLNQSSDLQCECRLKKTRGKAKVQRKAAGIKYVNTRQGQLGARPHRGLEKDPQGFLFGGI